MFATILARIYQRLNEAAGYQRMNEAAGREIRLNEAASRELSHIKTRANIFLWWYSYHDIIILHTETPASCSTLHVEIFTTKERQMFSKRNVPAV